MDNIKDVIKKYIDEDIAPFSMPGHKYGRAFKGKIDNLYDFLIRGDLTEVDGLDNMHHPEGVIKNSLKELKDTYKCNGKSYFLVNGSTSGNLAMIFSAFCEGDKILVERNCHRSVYNGIILRKLKPIYIDCHIDKKTGLMFPCKEEDIIKSINDNADAKGILLTYPNYYGMCIDIKKISQLCKERKILLLVDSAHGAHFGFSNHLPINAVEANSDMVVESAHKTLPSLTQTAFLHVNNKELIDNTDFYVSAYSSTSPSYMFMMSMEYGYEFLKNDANALYDDMYVKINKIKSKINMIKDKSTNSSLFTVIDREFIINNLKYTLYDFDFTRIIINVKEGCSGHKLSEFLRKNKVQCEMSDERNVVLIPTPFNIDKDYDKLLSALESCKEEDIKGDIKFVQTYGKYDKIYEPYEAFNMKKTIISIDDCLGKICGDNIVPYPPGIPMVVIGERITKEIILKLEELLSMNVDILGIENRNIKVLDKL